MNRKDERFDAEQPVNLFIFVNGASNSLFMDDCLLLDRVLLGCVIYGTVFD